MILQSDENLPLDAQMQITIGSIAIPRGSGTLSIIRLTGPQNSIAIKRSLMKISNDNHMCLATAIGRCFMQFCKVVSLLEWKEISKEDDPPGMPWRRPSNRRKRQSYYKHVGDSRMKRYGKQMALTLCMEAKAPSDRPLGLSDIKPFEDLLDVNIMVLSSQTGNRFCRVANKPGRRNIYLYMTEPEGDF